MRISDWSSDVCSSDLHHLPAFTSIVQRTGFSAFSACSRHFCTVSRLASVSGEAATISAQLSGSAACINRCPAAHGPDSSSTRRSEEHTSELQSLMRISYAVFCLKKKTDKYRL